MSTLDDRLIADYLDQLRGELKASEDEEREILREVRSHLLLATRDMGQDRALECFGTAQHIGQELRQVHGRATWGEALLAALPLLALGLLVTLPQAPEWLALLLIALPIACTATWIWWRRAHWPLWGWVWLGCIPLVVPHAPSNPLWGGLAYLVILLLVRNRNWLEATLALYPLPTVWAFQRTVLISREVQAVPWNPAAVSTLALGMTVVWTVLLARTLRTPSGQRRIARALESQGSVFLLNTLTVATARLWPTYPSPYPFTVNYFFLATLPYAVFHGLQYVLFTVLTALPAILALAQTYAQRRPPSRPIWSG